MKIDGEMLESVEMPAVALYAHPSNKQKMCVAIQSGKYDGLHIEYDDPTLGGEYISMSYNIHRLPSIWRHPILHFSLRWKRGKIINEVMILATKVFDSLLIDMIQLYDEKRQGAIDALREEENESTELVDIEGNHIQDEEDFLND